MSNEKINYVNATFVANEKGIKIDSKVCNKKSAYKNQVTVNITTVNGVNSVSGTIFDEDVQRIIQINSYIMEIEPSGKMILLSNSDVPGVVGHIGNILSTDGINIADFRLGRSKSGALAVILVDEDVPSQTLKKLEDIEAANLVSYAQI